MRERAHPDGSLLQTLFSSQDNGALNTKTARSVIWGWQSAVLVFVAAYTATLTTILSADETNLVNPLGGVLTTDDTAHTTLGAAVQACPLCVCIQKGGAGQTYLNGTLRIDMSKVQDEKAAPFPLYVDSNRIKKIKAMIDEGSRRAVWVEKETTMKYILASIAAKSDAALCGWKLVGQPFGTSTQAMDGDAHATCHTHTLSF